ncbi:hypothetical protein AsAng_0026580 [Aureispira anguillae]|uniref:Uncharacterized protein n=1 Tax=Aureispira anguillae TaxID=2864201 RepID=A0A915YFA7_9BACT|nr:hypothetical protein AsAng_0026580 [Aureispira anguillae]
MEYFKMKKNIDLNIDSLFVITSKEQTLYFIKKIFSNH